MPDNDTGRFRVTLPSESTELPKTNSTMEPPQGMIPGIRQLGGTEETVRETIVRSMREVEQKSAAAPNIGGHEPLPRSWIEAVPAILFGFYGLACAFEAVAAMNRGDFFIFSLNSGACALLAGISLAWWKRRDWLPQKLVSTATLIVTDARWILASISVLLIVSALAPFVEQRRWPYVSEKAASAPVAGTWTAIPKNSGASEGPISWQEPFQLMRIGTANGIQIDGLYFQGISNSQIQMKEAYIISDMTGHKEQLKANIQYKGEFPVNQVDIPSGASVDLVFEWKPQLSVGEFLDQWGKFRFVAMYNEFTYEKSYDENFVRGLVQNTIPGVIGPRMTPKGQ
jgi:hypothetical protein